MSCLQMNQQYNYSEIDICIESAYVTVLVTVFCPIEKTQIRQSRRHDFTMNSSGHLHMF